MLTRELDRLDQPAVVQWLAHAGIDDPALRAAIATLCDSVPLMLSLAVAPVAQAREQGHQILPADFALPQPREPATPGYADVVYRYLVDSYLAP